ncbi:hypothetical protein [Nesterenkonia pannonica]|uniref:hypothetical protein n=1 Tax=Nesterenkonia pannonica TaxID=1548602 RepID=UPI0021649A92|nr:hypothetical protein [Nesterenkonia pannonica]
MLGGRLIHPKLTWLSFGVGSGLIFAAASNTCGMAYALSRMPWNRAERVPTLDSALASIAETPPSTP